MESVFQDFFNFTLLVNIFLGMALNGFIVLMNCKTWMRKKSLPTGEKIITILCLSRWVYQCVVGAHNILFLSLLRAQLSSIRSYFGLARVVMNYITIWFASLLCVYYCVKIANYKHVVFLYLKERMSKLVPRFLALCVFSSLVLSLPFGFKTFSAQAKPSTSNSFQNSTMKTFAGTYLMGSLPPFIIFTIAFFLTVPSLWRHIRNMSGVGASFRNPDMNTHYNAIKSMAAFFLLHSLFIVCVNFDLSGLLARGTLQKSLMSMMIMVYPCLHSAVIIFYNRTLRRGFLALLTFGLGLRGQ